MEGLAIIDYYSYYIISTEHMMAHGTGTSTQYTGACALGFGIVQKLTILFGLNVSNATSDSLSASKQFLQQSH